MTPAPARTAGSRPAVRALLRRRGFVLLWTAGLISLTGDWLVRVALPIYAFQLTGSPVTTATVVGAGVAARLLVGPLAGLYVDRWDRRRVMLGANLLQAAALLPLLAVTAADQMPIAYGVVFAQAVLAQFVEPAEHALLPRLVETDQLTAANSLNALNNNLARLAGPALGGLAAATLGLGAVALLNTAALVLAAGLVGLIPSTHRSTREPAGPASAPGGGLVRLRRDLTAGVRVLARSRLLRAVAAVVAVTAVGEGVFGALLPVFVSRELAGDARHIGWLMSGQAVGGIAGALLVTRFASRVPPAWLASVGLVGFGLFDLMVINYPRWFTGFGPVVALIAVVGLMTVPMTTGLLTLLQTEVADALRGRVFATVMVGQSAAMLVGAAIAGAVTDRFGVIPVLTVQGVAPILAGLGFAVAVRRATRAGGAPRPTVPAGHP